MKEHPDYKYRPRRKPKTLVKSPTPTHQQSDNHHHHHRTKDSSSPPSQTKYPFNSQFELALTMPQRHPPAFSIAPYVPMEAITSPMSTIALDLQARLHAMYYQSWRNAYNPTLIPTSAPTPDHHSSPSPPTLLYGGTCGVKSTKSESPTPVVQTVSPAASNII